MDKPNSSFGFTLFGMLLLGIIISIVLVTSIRYLLEQNEVAAAEAYGQNLYTYGQAASQYVMNNAQFLYGSGHLPGPSGKNTAVPNATHVTSPPGYNRQIVINGVAWLSQANAGNNVVGNAPYISSNFNMNAGVSPLTIAQPLASGTGADVTKENNLSVITTIYYDSFGANPPQLSIQVGALYEQSGSTLKLRPDLTQAGIQHANTLYTSYTGPASIVYTYPYLTAATPASAQPTGAINPQTEQSPYLMVKGSNNGGNSMNGSINFQMSSGQGMIQNLGQLSFNGGGSAINNLTTLNMVQNAGVAPSIDMNFYSGATAGGSVTNLTNLIMLLNPTAPTLTSINNLLQLTFDQASAALGNIVTGLDSLNFRNASVSSFTGFTVQPSTIICTGWNGNVCSTGVKAFKNGKPSSLCFLNYIQTQTVLQAYPAGTNNMYYSGCMVNIDFTGVWVVTNMDQFVSTCNAACLIWSN